MDDLNTFKHILSDFNSIPPVNTNPTFMDICQLEGDRFEERCSQILRFYLDPNGPHRLKSLLLHSLLHVIHRSEISFSPSITKVQTEEMTDDGKYIDITVITDTMAIAIENKIRANLYNPLESYVSYIHKNYADKEYKLFVLLSVRSLCNDELRKLQDNGYIYVNYAKLFFAIKLHLGTYALDADQAYLTFLLDFMRTIENRYYNRNMELKQFFYNNRSDIDRLIWHYEAFKKDILNLRKDQISMYRSQISACTHAEWLIYQGWDLYISFNDDRDRIGIESSFRDGTVENPLGMFHIYITVWKKSHFSPYERALKEAYPDCFIDYNACDGTRIFLHVATLSHDNTEEIISALSNTYNTLKAIVENCKTDV